MRPLGELGVRAFLAFNSLQHELFKCLFHELESQIKFGKGTS